MKFKYVIRAVTIAGLLGILAGTTMAGTPIRLSFRDTTVLSGRAITYGIYADSSFTGYSVSAYQLTFTYNTNLFKFTGATNAGTLTSTWGLPTVFEGPPGTVNIVGASSDTLVGTGRLVTLQFNSTQFTGFYNQGGSFTFQSAVFNQGFPTASFRTGFITLTPAPSIVVSPNTALLTKGDILQFGVSGGKVPYTWASSSPTIASIDTLGKLTALSAGFTKVVSTDSSGYVDTTGLVEVRAYRLSFRDTSRYQGQTVDLPIYCTNLTGLNVTSGQFTVSYNSSYWTALGTVEAGTILSPYGPSQFSVGNGTISISFAGGPTALTGSGILIYVRFKASTHNYGGTGLSIQNVLFNENLFANVGTGNMNVLSLGTVNVNPGGPQTLVVGDSIHFTGSGGIPPYTWSVSDTSRSLISSTGWLKGKRGGSVIVTVKDSIGGSGSSGTITLYDFRVSIPDTLMTTAPHLKVPIFVSSNGIGFSAFQLTITNSTNYYVRIDTVDATGTLTAGWSIAQSFGNGTSNIVGAAVNKITSGGVLLYLNFVIPDSTPKPSTTSISFASILFSGMLNNQEVSVVALSKNGSLQLANGPVFAIVPASASLHAKVGLKDSATLTVRNPGLANLTSSISVIGSSAFTVSTTSLNVSPGDSIKIKVYFLPATNGPATATIRFITNDPYHNPVDVPVTGSTPYPILGFSTPNINFGTVKVGQHKDTTVTISNTGTDTLKITNITGSLAVFTAHPTNSNIPPGQSIVDTVRFAPSAGGSVSGRISVSSNSLSSPDTLGVSGSGNTLYPILVLSNSSFSFGIVSLGTFKDTVVTISNNGTDTLKISGITTSNSAFAARPISRTVPPGQSFKDTLRFVPALAGGYSGRIFVASNAPSSPDTITVLGTGHAPFPILAFSSSAVNFGGVKVGSFKDTTITISNSGTDTLKISSSTASLSVFSARPTVRTVPPGQSASDTLRFAPTAPGGYSGRIVVVSNALSSPDTISVSGTGNPATDVSDQSVVPDAYSMQQNYPNPFNPSTMIRYGLRSRSTVRLVIYNILGQMVDELVDGEQNEGFHSLTWNPSVPSGAYFYRIEVTSMDDPNDHFTQIRKMILMK